jgi:hypothetical protein
LLKVAIGWLLFIALPSSTKTSSMTSPSFTLRRCVHSQNSFLQSLSTVLSSQNLSYRK